MKSSRTRWIRGMGAVVLVGGLMITGWGFGVTSAAPPANNPFQAILDKLDQVLAALNGAAGQSNHTLRWDSNNPSATRFTTAFPGAVLDNNTGLVWEQAPDATVGSWPAAIFHCVNRKVGGTVGWRLPSVAELKSVQDGSPGAVAPLVPASAFTIQSSVYWSATQVGYQPNFAWAVDFGSGLTGVPLGNAFIAEIRTALGYPSWCVRGGMNADAY